ncbi:protein Mis18-alpha isoform X2 [Dendropsophus ebraccatus]|uniref:protein Mis18-alpha isoform X2 n=1 Tax=Dendropsophus ebraccatus TaxID=150705 RepID=UPI003831E304
MAEGTSDVCGELKDGPALFMCSSCGKPLADSGDWVGEAEGGDIILVKAVTTNVKIDACKALSSYELDAFSTVQVLYCEGCSNVIGALYLATPQSLDYKRDLFSLNTSAINCYYFGKAPKRKIQTEPRMLPTVTLMETQLEKCKTMFGICEKTVAEMEKKLLQSNDF